MCDLVRTISDPALCSIIIQVRRQSSLRFVEWVIVNDNRQVDTALITDSSKH